MHYIFTLSHAKGHSNTENILIINVKVLKNEDHFSIRCCEPLVFLCFCTCSCEFPSLPSSYRQTAPPSIPLSVSPEPQPETPTTLSSSFPETQQGPSCEESLGQEYHLSARRERSAGELRVEALARQLVSRGDKTLTPMLDSWAEGGRTMDLMEEIFPAGGGRLLWQCRRSSTCLEDR